MEDCKIPVSNILGGEGQGFKIAMKGLDGGRVNIGACSLGGAQKCIDLTKEYVSQRKQFGAPLANLQVTKKKNKQKKKTQQTKTNQNILLSHARLFNSN